MPDPRIRPIAESTLKSWGANLEAAHIRAFQFGGHQMHGGDSWAVLSESTVKQKGFRTVLVRTGALQDSIFVDVSGLNLLIGTDKKYAVYHQTGTRHMPQRKVIDITRQDIDALVKSLTNNLGKQGFKVIRTI